MQSTLHFPSDSPTFHFSSNAKSSGVRFAHQKPILAKQKLSFKTLSLSKSLRSPCQYEIDAVENGEGPSSATVARLPVVIRRSGKVSRYFWDGNFLRLVCVDGGASAVCFTLDDGFRKLFRIFSSAVRNFFIPRQVPGNYMDYVKWKFLHRVFSSALQVLATQAMLRAIGIGFSRSLPSAAALNWVLKDGLGRLSRCIYTASLASDFDTNLKRVRFSTSILFSLSIGVELLTPAFPHYFLLLATVANTAKQISLACYLATSSAVHRSFAVSDNLGEVSAKAQIQTVCFDNIGLMLAALLNILFKNSQRLQVGLPFVVYPIFLAIELFGIYQGLKHVHLQTLTKDRLLIILNTWIQLGYVPSPAEVSKKEGINILWNKSTEMWPIRIGYLNPKCQMPELSAATMQSLSKKDFHFICMEIVHEGLTRIEQQGILLCIREGADSADVTMGLLQACYIRKALISSGSRWENVVKGCYSDLVLREWFKLIEDSKQCARDEMNKLNEEMLRLGWVVRNILLSTQEQARYSFVDH
ncbi:protein root UVB sensitive 4 isoform X1 [Malania oleifera]|uniref:protein root UVB sensitive 4 isoform X1 n=1 Tax=Malania oleifera TaxID=397392 RepID=UPI0025AE8344|nr:protein root UVB sensitive 4 isoform X1 [Malania oleifera]